MHTIEPFYRWRKYYIASEDSRSPFYGRVYSEFEFINKIYNYLIHPQWDEFGSETLYLKILFADYNLGFVIIELLGEWNDTLYNDIMYLKREVIDILVSNGIKKFILIGENVLNFHSSDDSYYEDWFNDLEGGWIVAISFQEHVIQEFLNENINYYINFSSGVQNFEWRKYSPLRLFDIIDKTNRRELSINL